MGVLLLFSVLNIFQGDTIAYPWPFQHVDELSNSAVTSVYMDQNDRVWLGTWDGLDRYDGSSITVYKPDPFSKGKISNNVVRDFLEDGDGNLWIITHQGINKYSRETDTFQTYLDSLPGIPFLEYNIRACKGSDSTIWASLLGKGIYHYKAKENNFVPINFAEVDSLWLQTVVNVGSHRGLFYLLGRDGKLVCTVNNLQVFSKQLLDIVDPLSSHKFLTINQHYYLAITSGSGEFIFVDLSDIERKPQHIQLKGLIVSSLSENLTQTAIWVGTESGDIFKLKDTGSGFLVEPMNVLFPTFSKAKIKILTITETHQNLLWVGTDGDGVYKFLTRPTTFFSINAGTESGQISHGIVRSVYEDVSGTLYIGTRGRGLNIISSRETKIINTHAGLSNDAVLSINKDHVGNMWIGVDGEGVDMIEANSQKIFHFPRDLDDSHSLVFGSVYSICVDSFNDIWLGTSGFGIVHLKVEKTILLFSEIPFV